MAVNTLSVQRIKFVPKIGFANFSIHSKIWAITQGLLVELSATGFEVLRSLMNKLHSCINDLLTAIGINVAATWLDIKLNQDLGCCRIFYGQNCMSYSSVVEYFIVTTLGGNYVR